MLGNEKEAKTQFYPMPRNEDPAALPRAAIVSQFSKAEHLKRHERSHSRVRPYRCHICHKSYGRSDVLHRHSKQHERDSLQAQTESAARATQPALHDRTSRAIPEPPNLETVPLTDQAQSPQAADSQSAAAQIGPVSDSTSSITVCTGGTTQQTRPGPQDVAGGTHMELDVEFSSMTPLVGVSNHSADAGIDPSNHTVTDTAARSEVQGTTFPETYIEQRQPNREPEFSVAPFETIVPPEGFTAPGSSAPQFHDRIESNHFDMDHHWWMEPEYDIPLSSLLDGSFELHSAGGAQAQTPSRDIVGVRDRRISTSSTLSTMSDAHLSRLQRFWARETDRKTKLISTLWQSLINGNGLYGNCGETLTSLGPGSDGWSLDSETKVKIYAAFHAALSVNGLSDSSYAVITPELLEIAYTQYIDHHHTTMPVIHLPTFLPKNAPISLLLVICTIGLNIMGTAKFNRIVRQIFPSLLNMTSDELYASRNSKTPATRLLAMTTALLVLTLSSIMGNAQTDGLFLANEYPQSPDLLKSVPTEEKRWKIWASFEAVKRLILHLVQLDCWYSSFLATDPILRPQVVQVVPACEHALFQARSLDQWSKIRPDFEQMEYPVVSGYRMVTTDIRGADVVSSIMILVQLRCRWAVSLVNQSRPRGGAHYVLLPWQVLREDAVEKPLSVLLAKLSGFPSAGDASVDINAAVSWHAACMALGANINLFEDAVGRTDPKAAAQATKEISAWALTSSARRCCLHAAHIFKLLLNRRYSQPVQAQSVSALFQAAIIFGFYICAMPTGDDRKTGNPIDLFDDIDWESLGDLGFSDVSTETTRAEDSLSLPTKFIIHGGSMLFFGYPLSSGYGEARKSWLHFASLMLGLGRWKSRHYSRILHVICDSLSDLDPSEVGED
ncbi:hypothetical protein JX266_010025 [Neoarthrinium moseri]|nr:hypothetical protein JX266_010025 [Neoarthrinium moseri]